jgi:hypothetical protein
MSVEHVAVWERLLASALLGTERQAGELPKATGELGTTLAALPADDREGALLGAAGVLALYRRAGRIPPALPTEAAAAEPCEAEPAPRVGLRAARQLQQMLDGTFDEVLPEWLELAASACKRIPEELLPAALDCGRQHHRLREPLLPVIGRCGAWLAARNPEWAWAIGGATEELDHAKDLFQTGGFDARNAVLKQLREQDPQAACEMLQTTWKDDGADERQRFLGALTTKLSMADEPFLEDALDDRSKKVRAQAAELLTSLPESRLVQRMTERLSGVLTFTPAKKGMLAKLARAKGKLEVKLPEACDKALERDGIEPKPPSGSKKMGQKAWWLQQMIACVPPSAWTKHWETTPKALCEAAAATDWQRPITNGLTQATLRTRDAAWAEALLDTAAPVELLMLLDPARQDAWLLEKLKKTDDPLADKSPLMPFLSQYDRLWSPELARAVLDKLRRIAGSNKSANTHWHLRSTLKTFALHMPTEVLPEANNGWPKEAAGWDSWFKPVDGFLGLFQFRHDMREALRE